MSDKRADGTKKGAGFFGPITRPDGKVSTEISIGVGLNGKETQIPLMVPGLTAAELKYLLGANPGTPDFMSNMPPSIIDKAVAHAADRIKNNQSPFAGENERYDLPKE